MSASTAVCSAGVCDCASGGCGAGCPARRLASSAATLSCSAFHALALSAALDSVDGIFSRPPSCFARLWRGLYCPLRLLKFCSAASWESNSSPANLKRGLASTAGTSGCRTSPASSEEGGGGREGSGSGKTPGSLGEDSTAEGTDGTDEGGTADAAGALGAAPSAIVALPRTGQWSACHTQHAGLRLPIDTI